MKCPSCKGLNLKPSFLEGLFRAHTCADCGGNWILIEDYVAWKERNTEFTFSQEANFEIEDSKKALLCPVTGMIMQKYRIAQDSKHRLDYSPKIGGVWLDKGEWEYLKKNNLAGSLNKVFTSQWQKSVRDKNSEITFSDIYEEKFGKESYDNVKEIRNWIRSHPSKADLLAYIVAEDPYSAEK